MCSSRPSSRRTSVYCQEDPSKIQQGRESGKWLNVKIIAVQGTMVVINTGTSIFQLNASKPRRPLDTADLEEHPDSCERTGAPVLRLSCEGEIDIFELFSDNFYLSAILDRQGLMEAAPVDLRTKKAEGSFLTTGTTRLLVKDQNEESQNSSDVINCIQWIH